MSRFLLSRVLSSTIRINLMADISLSDFFKIDLGEGIFDFTITITGIERRILRTKGRTISLILLVQEEDSIELSSMAIYV